MDPGPGPHNSHDRNLLSLARTKLFRCRSDREYLLIPTLTDPFALGIGECRGHDGVPDRQCRIQSESSSSSSLLFSSLEWSDAQVYEPQLRALIGTAAYLCEVVDLKWRYHGHDGISDRQRRIQSGYVFFFFFFTLVTGPRSSLNLS